MRELGEIDMVSMALATLDLVTHDHAQPALVGESERVLRHDSKALVLCAGDREADALRELLG